MGIIIISPFFICKRMRLFAPHNLLELHTHTHTHSIQNALAHLQTMNKATESESRFYIQTTSLHDMQKEISYTVIRCIIYMYMYIKPLYFHLLLLHHFVVCCLMPFFDWNHSYDTRIHFFSDVICVFFKNDSVSFCFVSFHFNE